MIAYSVYLAIVKKAINSFYSEFYDLLQMAGAAAAGELGSGSGPAELGSGAAAARSLADYRAEVWDQLWQFARIVAPLVWAAPAAKWLRSAWAFAWRLALMRGYLKGWDARREPIEGASQRLHEDSQRFASALQGCLATVLDAVFTLSIFTPILLRLSAAVAPPVALPPLLAGAWLWLLALGAAGVGLGGAVFFGQRLVFLEVNNQRVEALLRKDLVLLETTPAMIVGVPHTNQHYAPHLYFQLTLKRLSANYHSLFRHFTLVNGWLSLFDQVMLLMPYFLAAPLLFADDPARRITLGTLVQVSNSFDKVFASLSVIAENWTAINEFRSVLVRLREFEAELYATPARAQAQALARVAAPSAADAHSHIHLLRHARSFPRRGGLRLLRWRPVVRSPWAAVQPVPPMLRTSSGAELAVVPEEEPVASATFGPCAFDRPPAGARRPPEAL